VNCVSTLTCDSAQPLFQRKLGRFNLSGESLTWKLHELWPEMLGGEKGMKFVTAVELVNTKACWKLQWFYSELLQSSGVTKIRQDRALCRHRGTCIMFAVLSQRIAGLCLVEVWIRNVHIPTPRFTPSGCPSSPGFATRDVPRAARQRTG
jgi:hypothetical protein